MIRVTRPLLAARFLAVARLVFPIQPVRGMLLLIGQQANRLDQKVQSDFLLRRNPTWSNSP